MAENTTEEAYVQEPAELDGDYTDALEDTWKCSYCGATKTPQKRKNGLCNACGLRTDELGRPLPKRLPRGTEHLLNAVEERFQRRLMEMEERIQRGIEEKLDALKETLKKDRRYTGNRQRRVRAGRVGDITDASDITQSSQDTLVFDMSQDNDETNGQNVLACTWARKVDAVNQHPFLYAKGVHMTPDAHLQGVACGTVPVQGTQYTVRFEEEGERLEFLPTLTWPDDPTLFVPLHLAIDTQNMFIKEFISYETYSDNHRKLRENALGEDNELVRFFVDVVHVLEEERKMDTLPVEVLQALCAKKLKTAPSM